MRKKFFYFYPLTTSPECAILYALTLRKLSRFCLSRKVIASFLRRWPFCFCSQNHLIIFLFLRLSICLSRKIFFIFPLDKAGKVYIIYAVCFYLDCLCHYLRWSRKGRSLLRTTFFYFKIRPLYRIAPYCQRLKIWKNILFSYLTTKENPI